MDFKRLETGRRRFGRNGGNNWQERKKRTFSQMRGEDRFLSDSNSYDKRTEYDRGPSSSRLFGNNDEVTRYCNKNFIGFKTLQDMAKSEINDIILKINDKRNAFLNFIKSHIDKADAFVLVIEILSKTSQSPFEELKLKLLLEVCNSDFIKLLMLYLIKLPYEGQRNNMLYWNDQNEFWNNYITFCEYIVSASPMTALKNCGALINATTKSCLEGLLEKHKYSIPEDYGARLSELRNKLATFEEMEQEPERKRPRHGSNGDQEPPEDFRQLSIIPTRDDLVLMTPFIRPNVVNGSYTDIEHYLDVQFRLLREDCFGPLRDGIQQFIKDPNKKKYDSIRVFRNVKFVQPYISQTRVGSVVQMDVKTNRYMSKMNWAHNKRFIFGSLLLFTKDNCKNFIVATILDRDPKQLSEGKIPVSIIGDMFDDQLYKNAQYYTMIESEVYFEPYYHVLKVLQDPNFPRDLPMQQYIVQVNPNSKHPSYLTEGQEFTICDNDKQNNLSIAKKFKKDGFDRINNIKIATKFKVLESDTWPDKNELSFNDSQYEAYKLALTHEFAVIQGPPGTGKTYLGVKVAKTLLQNIRNINGCKMLIICYTNHALDQFLEAILKITKSVVRIGGQSRNENMAEINITHLRKSTQTTHNNANRLFREQKFQLKSIVNELQNAQHCLDVLTDGVISYRYIKDDVKEIQLLGNYYQRIGITDLDPLKHWLFDYETNEYWTCIDDCIRENDDYGGNDSNLESDYPYQTDFVIDDEDFLNVTGRDQDESIIKASFSLNDAKFRLKNIINAYKAQTQGNKRILYDLGVQMQNVASEINFFTAMKEQRSRRVNMRITANTHFFKIKLLDRWALYFMWVESKINQVKENIMELQLSAVSQATAYEESRMVLDLQVLHNVDVVGMTTSGAARMRKLIQAIAPPIVIVEEAAEVLEQHIVSSLTKNCQHLILIGDHQQLRPSASHMKLARDYDIEVSLFERMIKNGIHSRRLGVQHRMRPEIAALISPHIYPELENHSSVETFPDVLGMEKNVFFFTHQYEEEQNVENSSKSNPKEADMVLALANYLMQQGYKAEDITILTAYSGQMFYLKKEHKNYPHLKNVKITVVDNYQGEESKIILLSLVRNNKESKIGFLGTENRVCVALSRAREGFYIFGNIEVLKSKSELWAKIATTLEVYGSLGTAINLKCQNHPNNLISISKKTDFVNAPQGGCTLNCDKTMQCGHKCLLLCHGYDRNHTELSKKCKKNCERKFCELNHKCPLKCGDTCEPCKILIDKVLPCGHNMKLYCHISTKNPSIRCFVPIEVTLPDCSHKAKKLCCENIKTVKCKVRCDYRIKNCGHVCMKLCHVNNDPDHEEYKCEKKCAKANKGCTAGLEGDLGNHQCLKKCFEKCDTCKVIVLKKFPDCKHKIEIECNREATGKYCKIKCERTLPCGHKCPLLCAANCDPLSCNELSTQKYKLPCGHHILLPCNLQRRINTGNVPDEELLQHCTHPCNQELACKHLCGGSCATCHQGRLHVPCSQKCNQLNICGHPCEEPCNQICPPCSRPCEVRCQHSRCREKCSVPCTPCKEKCSRRCKHRKCIRRCGEDCNVSACSERCPRTLKCGHKCCGVCGEPCPNICRVCRFEDFPVDFLGDPYPDNTMFIQLQDCQHILELEDMDTLMLGDEDSIKIRTCPFCRKPIINTNIYKNAVNKTLRDYINPIKSRVYGRPFDIKNKKKELQAKLIDFSKTYKDIIAGHNQQCMSAFTTLLSAVKTIKYESLLDLEMLSIYLNILNMISECYKKYIESKSTELKEEIKKQISLICGVLAFKRKGAGVTFKISQQQQLDAGKEIKRLNAIVQFSIILSHATYKAAKSTPGVVQAYDEARSSVFSFFAFEEEKCLEALKKLQKVVNVSGIVSKQERDLVVKAIGLKAGHWFKCPNGHFYCIANCGGAMVESVCIECKAKVGGTRHKLLSTNNHAGELDGSSFPAYSEQYNNLANFRLDDIV